MQTMKFVVYRFSALKFLQCDHAILLSANSTQMKEQVQFSVT